MKSLHPFAPRWLPGCRHCIKEYSIAPVELSFQANTTQHVCWEVRKTIKSDQILQLIDSLRDSNIPWTSWIMAEINFVRYQLSSVGIQIYSSFGIWVYAVSGFVINKTTRTKYIISMHSIFSRTLPCLIINQTSGSHFGWRYYFLSGSEIPETLYHFFWAIDVALQKAMHCAHCASSAVTGKIQ